MLVPATHTRHALTISTSLLLTRQGRTPEIGKLLPYATYKVGIVGRIFKPCFQVGRLFKPPDLNMDDHISNVPY